MCDQNYVWCDPHTVSWPTQSMGCVVRWFCRPPPILKNISCFKGILGIFRAYFLFFKSGKCTFTNSVTHWTPYFSEWGLQTWLQDLSASFLQLSSWKNNLRTRKISLWSFWQQRLLCAIQGPVQRWVNAFWSRRIYRGAASPFLFWKKIKSLKILSIY